MKTTVHISDALLAEVQTIAARRKTTLRALIDEGLRHVVAKDSAMKTHFVLPDLSTGDPRGPDPLAGRSWDEIRSLMYGDRE